MSYDASEPGALTEAECRALLSKTPIGRIVFTDQALPAIQPVNFVMHEGDVIIRTAQGSKLAAATRNAIAAFEIDDYDEPTRTGWSVVVVGRAHVVTDPPELTRLKELPLTPWPPGHHPHYIRIKPEILTGRPLPDPA